MELNQEVLNDLKCEPHVVERIKADLDTANVVAGGLMANFKDIALPLVARGFRVTPVHPETKMGVMRNWQNFQLTAEAEVLKYAGYFADHNAGVVGKRGVGRHCFLDIDSSGVVERIEAETGQKMPKTYTVQSRPQSAPWKIHYYFLQTEYSFKKFGEWASKNVNVRDLTTWTLSDKGNQIHPTLYDLKGIGGGALVVAAGSVRANGEVYLCVDDSPVIPIPDWLVNWLINDIHRYQDGKRREQAAKKKAKVLARQLGKMERERLRAAGQADGFDIFDSDIYDFATWRVATCASLGMSGKVLVAALVQQITQFCQNGQQWVDNGGMKTLEKIASDPQLKFGRPEMFYEKTDWSEGLELMRMPTKYETIIEIMKMFPDKISVPDAITRIASEMDKHFPI